MARVVALSDTAALYSVIGLPASTARDPPGGQGGGMAMGFLIIWALTAFGLFALVVNGLLV